MGSETDVHVIPLKSGMWRVVRFSQERLRKWEAAYAKWWEAKGHRLAVSPEMWEA